ncbi:Na-translocating system protein MpsB, partial [Xanthomonas perforans]
MTTTPTAMPVSLSHDVIIAAAQRAARAIPPLWPLASSVAVNPFLGQASEPLEMAGARLPAASGIAITMPRARDAERVQSRPNPPPGLQNASQKTPRAPRRPDISPPINALPDAPPPPPAP